MWPVTSTFNFSTPRMQGLVWTIVCKFGGDLAICLAEEAICAKSLQMDGQTDDGHCAIILAHWIELKMIKWWLPTITLTKCQHLLNNIIFLWFLLCLMQQSMHVAIIICLNCSFFRPGNGSLNATEVVLLVVVSTKAFRFTTDHR